ncbi:Zn-dependent alcohol dehydrogenase [Conyzicola nivalis]|uniref:Alcohol dehydrogenase n=1 Tax=Conyzicola nivalis TaxID=1477021 RepID=A0A916WJ84_9MICO|nr:Zn-dependent alcohol dehydrogenase [Conyzicola nivalis]GGB02541.1 alcohol dehydrogenase [Conyzicola nivalis]
MRAALIREVGQPFQVENITIAAPVDREVLVEIRASGLCHSDITVAKNGMGIGLPAVLGHEISGVVTAVGPAVSRIKVGDHVVAAALQPCGHCQACLRGNLNACSNPDALDRSTDAEPRLEVDSTPVVQMQGLGGFAEQALIHENQLVAIDPRMPFEQASIIGCAVATGAGSIFNAAKVRPGQSVAVFGCGGVGLNAIQAAVLAGATTIIAVDIQPDKLELAQKFGATAIVNSGTEDAAARILEITTGAGVDHAFVMIGVPAIAETAMASLGFGGTTYLVGGMRPGAALDVRPSPADSGLLSKQQGVRGIWLGSSNFYADIPMYVDLYMQGKLNLDDLISRRIDLDDINEAYEDLERGGIARSVITFPAVG